MIRNAHVLRLQKLNAKVQRGEELSAREIAYVKAVWDRVRAAIKPLVRSIEKVTGLSALELNNRLNQQVRFERSRDEALSVYRRRHFEQEMQR